ncbi:MAG: hypothetical protein A3D44_03095 [Candidatus Staskawiczbacteria bacterium RIFCSPHIGHO2_02_FULL_42_22]|uniref:Polysaccharide biosynthesis protein CapD-like domain-containing protein n=1 Tax=Candidatus Staskawiczbacteria bacterium RIFCSPHIGHO2_02_FULL_42_22 TaxID=1802207 RepID=A0A1G2I5A8_9BACT|nr:MAG: hypothetical protein A3D44_03095 [Candidatus Staskawiczbacteria bacterium RIFCSPHIGHO2_02_FULL_42_22]
MFNLLKKTALKRTLFFVTTDIVFIMVSVWLAFILRFDGSIPEQYVPFLFRMIVLAIFFTIPIFYFKRLYSFSWSYVSSGELISLFFSTTLSFIFLSITIFASHYFPRFINFPRSTIFISYFLVFIFCSLTRFSKRIYLHVVGFKRMENKERTLIVGAGDAGEQILRNILSSKEGRYFPVGFLDDSPMKRKITIHGCRVLGTIFDMPEVIKNNDIKQLIIALPSANNRIVKEVIALARQAGLRKIKVAPQLHQIISGQISLKNLKDVEVEDLLGRNEITVDKKQIERLIKGKVVLITGAAGSIGSELSRQVAKFSPLLLVLLDQDETGIFNISKELQEKFPEIKIQSLVADVTDKEKIQSVFAKYKPQIVFHAAAYKHVPLMEEQSDEAVKNNVFGLENVAQASLACGAQKFIFISTDKAVNPTSVMGATKRIGEMICQVLSERQATSFISVRFGNVLNSRGSVIPIFKEQIRRGGPVEVTHPDMKRYFMLISEACSLVMQAGAMGSGGQVLVLDMGKPIKIVDLAREMIKASGFKPDEDIAIVFVGMRPGEKLFEEIMTAEEGIASTQNQKIFTAKLSAIDVVHLQKNMDILRQAVKNSDTDTIKKTIKMLIPSFTPTFTPTIADHGHTK